MLASCTRGNRQDVGPEARECRIAPYPIRLRFKPTVLPTTVCSAVPSTAVSIRDRNAQDSPPFRAARNFAMDRILRLVHLLLLVVAPLAAALKFDLHPVSPHDAAKYERCVRNFVAKEQLVVITATLDGYRGDGQRVDMHVCGASKTSACAGFGHAT
jgi:hypothetical protein